jgi:hypothetical protein
MVCVVSVAPVGISAADPKTSPSISTVISLLSTLCRGSPSITHDLLRSQLPEAIEKALQGDERLDRFKLLCYEYCLFLNWAQLRFKRL